MNIISKYFTKRKIKKINQRMEELSSLASMARISNNGDVYQECKKNYRELEEERDALSEKLGENSDPKGN